MMPMQAMPLVPVAGPSPMPIEAMLEPQPQAVATEQPVGIDQMGLPVQQLVQWFEDSEESTLDARKAAERDRDYYDNKQLTAAELQALAKRGQPDIIINRIQTKVNYLLGYESSQRTDPRAFPRNPADEDASEACTDALRYLQDDMNLKQVFSQVWENMLIEGYGGAEVQIEPTPDGDATFTASVWHWDRLFYDPHSREHDYSDARYFGGVIWMDREQAEEMFPERKDIIGRTINEENSRTYSDRPYHKAWAAKGGSRERVRLVQMWHKHDGVWINCIFTSGGKLKYEPSPAYDQSGRSICPMLLQSAFVDRENQRYGFVRALIGPQDEINKRRSKLLHEAVSNQTIAEEGAVDDINEMKIQAARPDGHIKINKGFRFEFVDRTPKNQLHADLLSEAKNEIDLMGPNAAMQGKGERNASGRAILANQQGGQIEIARLLDRHQHFRLRFYRLMWSLVRQYWTAQKWIRVTDDEKNIKFVGLNRPVTMVEELIKKRMEQTGAPEEQVKAEIKQMIAIDPNERQRLQQVIRMENVPSEMDMDITLEEVPDAANVQEEQFQILANLASAGIQFPPKIYILASGLRNKQRLIEELEKPSAGPEAQQAAQANAERAMFELEKLKSEIEKNRASATKTLVEADALAATIGIAPPSGMQPPANDTGPPQPMGLDPGPITDIPPDNNPPQQAGSSMPPPGGPMGPMGVDDSGLMSPAAGDRAMQLQPSPGFTGVEGSA